LLSLLFFILAFITVCLGISNLILLYEAYFELKTYLSNDGLQA